MVTQEPGKRRDVGQGSRDTMSVLNQLGCTLALVTYHLAEIDVT